MKNLARILAMSLFIIAFAGCDDDDEDTPSIVNFSTTLTGAKEVPPNDSDATGTAEVVYNDDTNKMTITVTYSGITPSDAHIHKGAVGVPGPVVFPFDNLVSPMVLTNVTLNADQEADLKAGLYYVNIHSAEYPDGEIRGQLED
jgi:hypothetical protein